MFIEFLFNSKKAKKEIGESKRAAIDALKEIEKQATSTDRKVSSVTSGMSEQRKFTRRLKGDALSQLTAGNDYAARKQFNEMLRAGFLRPSDFRGLANRQNLAKSFKSGAILQDFKQYQAEVKQSTTVTKPLVNEQQKSVTMLERMRNAFRKVSDAIDTNTTAKRRNRSESRLLNLQDSLTWRNLRNIAYQYTSIYAAQRMISDVFNSAVSKEREAFQMSVAFGNKANAMKAMQFADSRIAGGAPFKRNDLVKGFTEMMEAGLDVRKKKNFDLIGNMAGAKGTDFNKVASDIVSAIYGNTDVLRQYGFKNKQIFQIDRMVNQRPDNRRDVIMGILSRDARFKDGMRDFATSWDGMLNRMSGVWTRFKDNVMGSASDKNSLYSKIKSGFNSVIEWFERNKNRLQRVAIAVQTVFKWIGRQVLEFGRYIARKLGGVMGMLDGSQEQFQTKMMKMVLWLELTKERVVRFFDKWGWAIKMIAKVWLASKIVGMVNGIVSPFQKMYSYLKGAIGLLPRLTSLLRGTAAAAGTMPMMGAGGAAPAAGGGAMLPMMGGAGGLLLAMGGTAVVAAIAYSVLDAMSKKPPPSSEVEKAVRKNQMTLDNKFGGVTNYDVQQKLRLSENNATRASSISIAPTATQNKPIPVQTLDAVKALNEKLGLSGTSILTGKAAIQVQNVNVYTKSLDGRKQVEELTSAIDDLKNRE